MFTIAFHRCALLPLCLMAATVFCQAQGSFGQIRGKILDPNRDLVVGVRISAQSARSGRSTVTDENGEFSLALAPGEYALKVEANGFAPVTRQIKIAGAGHESLEIVLSLADSTATVTIVGSHLVSYRTEAISSATRTLTPLRDIPQSISVVTNEQIREQAMDSIADVVNYVPGITSHQGENNRDQLVIRGNSTSADFFLNGVRDDVQYYRDLYNVERVEALKGPNAMSFGRGGGGGVINRVPKEAGFSNLREITFQAGSFNNKRITADFDQPLNKRIAFRVNGLYENSGSFRHFVALERYGFNPTVTIVPGTQTLITLAFEHFHDGRVADRGIPSFRGKPADVPIATYFGNPGQSHVRAKVDLFSANIRHQMGRLTISNRTLFGGYDRDYQNFVPGAVNAARTEVALSAYNNATKRRNIFNQLDLTYIMSTGRIKHTLLGGAETGRQLTDNFRNTGFFNNTATSIFVPYDNPINSAPITFRQSATDANSHLQTNLASVYVQDQIEFSRHVQAIGGLRFDYFDLQFHNNRNGDSLRRIDRLVSPRTGIVIKPILPLSVYANYSVSYLPSSGDQFSSLTAITQQVKPEKFSNYELGAKWDVRPNLALTTAAYRQDRTNTRTTDPNDPTRILQSGSQRTTGLELGLNGSITRSWNVAGGYAYQDAFIASATIAAPRGARVAQVPRHTFSLWNKYQALPRLGLGLGIVHRSDMFAAIDNTVILPAYIKVDAAVYFRLSESLRLQTHFENVLNKKYYLNADGNNNISPGSPRGVRVGLIAGF